MSEPKRFMKRFLNCRQDYDSHTQSPCCPHRGLTMKLDAEKLRAEADAWDAGRQNPLRVCPRCERLHSVLDPCPSAEPARPIRQTEHSAPLRTFQLWRDEEGEFLVWGRWLGGRSAEAPVREFRSANWITAYWEAFRERPQIDRNIRDLVALLNQLPGMMTR